MEVVMFFKDNFQTNFETPKAISKLQKQSCCRVSEVQSCNIIFFLILSRLLQCYLLTERACIKTVRSLKAEFLLSRFL